MGDENERWALLTDNYSQTYYLEIILSRSYGYLIGTNNEILLQFFAISYCDVTMYFESKKSNIEDFSIMRRVSFKDGKLAK